MPIIDPHPPTTNPADPTLHAAFFAPLNALLAAGTLAATRPCPELEDPAFLHMGVQRVIDTVVSGRDFLQRLREVFSIVVGRSNFFAALHSLRRLKLVREINESLQAAQLAGLRLRGDPLASIPELDGREVWAADGTSLEHACHDARDAQGAHLPVKHIFSLDLRSGWSRLLCAFRGAEPHRHEIKSLKLSAAKTLRMGGRKGIIYTYDRAGIDFGLLAQAEARLRRLFH